jgi:hypothetical protein
MRQSRRRLGAAAIIVHAGAGCLGWRENRHWRGGKKQNQQNQYTHLRLPDFLTSATIGIDRPARSMGLGHGTAERCNRDHKTQQQ